MIDEIKRDPDLEWLDHVRPVGLVVAPVLLKELGLAPTRQTQADNAMVAEHIGEDESRPALTDIWGFVHGVLGWEAEYVAGSPGGSPLPDDLHVSLPEQATTLSPTWAVKELGESAKPWQLLVRIEPAGVDLDVRDALGGWEATAHQRFERLLRETGVHAGVLISEKNDRKDGEDRFRPELRVVFAPKGETSGYLSFPLRDLRAPAGRSMLGGLKLLLDSVRLFADGSDRRLPALLEKSREAQAAVSTMLAEQVLGALHELLRGFDAAAPDLVRDIARNRPAHLYEGLLTVLMRLVFVLYAEDRDLLPSRTDGRAQNIYETGYSIRGLYDRLTHDAALNPDTMDERRGAWGQLLALFRLIHKGHPSHFVQARGGKLFDPEQFIFLEGRNQLGDPPSVPPVSDGCVLRILEGLMTLAAKGGTRERLSYRTLDVEQIGSVYETVMGFRAEQTTGPSLAIKAGKNNRTPVFVDLKALLGEKGKDRVKYLKEEADRGQLSAGVSNAVQAAKTIAELAAALDPIADERGSPKKRAVAAGTPILQPTDERRRTGSHYTPRSLTEPIVRYALEPAFERLGPDATPEQILDLKVCDPAMGSGAFLVEACRALAARLVLAWARHPEKKPKNIPTDEDDELHAKRLVAQRCLYGVDKNPLATDLAKLSLWLATLARDHEFSFLDHALKCGDSLVGLTQEQIAAGHWDTSKPGLPLFRSLVKDRVDEAMKGRAEIQSAPDDTSRAIQEQRHRSLETRLREIRLMGDAVIAAFFSEDKPKMREKKRADAESWLGGSPAAWDKVTALALTLNQGERPLTPFHWEIEFPEVFGRENGGFDAIVGNPPFLGGKRISTNLGDRYADWLTIRSPHASQNVDLVGHFFLHAVKKLRADAAFGLIASNTIRQGATREGGLAKIIAGGAMIYRAINRLKWPGEAGVVVSVVHCKTGSRRQPALNGRPVSRISAYLVEGTYDESPAVLAENEDRAFIGCYVLGMGFTFDDNSSNPLTSSLARMNDLIQRNPRCSELIFPYVGGEEVNNDPCHAHHRFVIDYFDRPLERQKLAKTWKAMNDRDRASALRIGIVPLDYFGEVAADWPDLLEIIRRQVKPERDKQKRKALSIRWWQFAEKQRGLRRAIAPLPTVLVTNCGAAPHLAIAKMTSGTIFAHTLSVFAFAGLAPFCALQSRVHEVWARFFASSMKDDLRYTPSDCFETFPFPDGFEASRPLEDAGRTYHDHRAALMVRHHEGMTRTYNRFHDPAETADDIQRLRDLHAAMDRAVLEAYGWHDLAARAEPTFLDETNEDDHTYQGRLFWLSDFRDEVLARLLALNAERHAEEVRLGVAPGKKGEAGDEIDEDLDGE
jgi:hypothetical protein